MPAELQLGQYFEQAMQQATNKDDLALKNSGVTTVSVTMNSYH